jgi:histidine phosphotransfer protein HptB
MTMVTVLDSDLDSDLGLGLLLDLDFLRGNLSAMGDDLNESLLLLLEIYDEELPLLVTQLHGALAALDGEVVRRLAHTLKSSCGALGAVALAEVCQQMEGAARSADLIAVQGLLLEFGRLEPLTRGALAGCQF